MSPAPAATGRGTNTKLTKHVPDGSGYTKPTPTTPTFLSEQPTLFPVEVSESRSPNRVPFIIATRGRVEYGVRCPGCKATHRHIRLGKVAAPCGAVYQIGRRRA